MENALKTIIKQHKTGKPIGIYSVCSSNRYVLEASMKQALMDNSMLLIESTSNQVDQFGGYSGMNPRQFVQYVQGICRKINFPFDRIILGGDHLGPNVWQNLPSSQAMTFAVDQIKAYVEAGYTKIHLDTSMRCLDDSKNDPLNPATIAERAVQLCKAAEQANENSTHDLLYIIGSEVPIPGGAQEALTELVPTAIDDLAETIEVTKEAFYKHGLQRTWERVIAVVIQPGVEFSDSDVIEYDRTKARNLSEFIEQYENLVYEAHSTDYQTELKLKQLVEDHFAILKVGPALTFAFREAVLAIDQIETEMLSLHKGLMPSQVMKTVEEAMVSNPTYWEKYYHGNSRKQQFARLYSLSDRIRYYWPLPQVESALSHLINNLKSVSIPLSLVSQYLPHQYHAIRNGCIEASPEELIHHKIMEVVKIYASATGLCEKNDVV